MMSAFDPMSSSFLKDPYVVLNAYRDRAAAYRHEEVWPGPVVSVLRHAEVKATYRDYKTFSSFVPEDAREFELADGTSLIGEDPPLHTHLRTSVNKVFNGHAIQSLEPMVQKACDQIFDDALESGEVEMVEDIAARLAVTMISRLVGVPDSDHALIRDWTKRQSAINGASIWLRGEDDPNIERFKRITREANDEMQTYFGDRVDERLRSPQDDILTLLVESGLDRQEAISFAKLLVMAGNETTTNLINNATAALIDHPDQDQLVRSEPQRVSTAIEEVLRFAPPILYSVRTAVCDTELGGVAIKAEEPLVLWIGAANRDERVFENPEVFDIRREPKGGLAFGMGLHACLGSPLARLEGRVFLSTLIRRTQRVERVNDAMPHLPTPIFNGSGEQRVRLIAA